jgi:hypothetical protein
MVVGTLVLVAVVTGGVVGVVPSVVAVVGLGAVATVTVGSVVGDVVNEAVAGGVAGVATVVLVAVVATVMWSTVVDGAVRVPSAGSSREESLAMAWVMPAPIAVTTAPHEMTAMATVRRRGVMVMSDLLCAVLSDDTTHGHCWLGRHRLITAR